jgi:hypothetical protein
MKRIASLSTVLVTVGASAAGLIGKVVPPYPDGTASGGGLCVTIVSTCDHSIGVLVTSKGAKQELLALRGMGRKPDGTPIWQVTDEIEVPPLKPGQVLLWCISTVSTYAIVDGNTIAEWLNPYWATKLNASGERFEILKVDGVRCANTALEAD